MTKILLSQDIHPQARKMLDGFEVFLPKDNLQASLVSAAKEADAIILRTVTCADAQVIENAPKLKIISRTGAGIDNVDVAEATKKGILVCNVPTASNISVAEHTLSLILSLAKDLPAMDKAVRSGAWKERNKNKAIDIEGKTLGIIGMGKIGSLVAAKANLGLGMKILAYDPFVASNFKQEGYTFVPKLEDLFENADFITLHCPNIPQTKGMVNKGLIDLMKPTSYLINCARGGVVDEAPLYEALRNKKIAGAALDVFSIEPPSSSDPLLSLDNILLTPHMAALTKEASVRVAVGAAQAVIDYFSQTKPQHICNAKELGL
jgi:D-3-phosphoglycerate dehydrogenase